MSRVYLVNRLITTSPYHNTYCHPYCITFAVALAESFPNDEQTWT